MQQRYERFVTTRPGLSELLADAEMVEGDFYHLPSLAYRGTQYAGRGWALGGDAAAFLDPLYSHGLDHATFSTYATAGPIGDDLAGHLSETDLGPRLGPRRLRSKADLLISVRQKYPKGLRLADLRTRFKASAECAESHLAASGMRWRTLLKHVLRNGPPV